MVRRGQRGEIVSETRRTYSEFQSLYGSYDAGVQKRPVPAFPDPLSSLAATTNELELRRRQYERILLYMVCYTPNHPSLNRFLLPSVHFTTASRALDSFISAESVTLQGNQQEMQEITHSSPLHPGSLQVSIKGTNDTHSGRDKFTIYEIETVLKASGLRVSAERRYTDFKKLISELKKRHEVTMRLPKGGFGVSSTDPKVVAMRKVALEALLQELVSREEVLAEPDLQSFLCLTDIL